MSGIVNANHLLGFSVGTDIALMPLKSVTEQQTAVMELTVRKKSHVEGSLDFMQPRKLV